MRSRNFGSKPEPEVVLAAILDSESAKCLENARERRRNVGIAVSRQRVYVCDAKLFTLFKTCEVLDEDGTGPADCHSITMHLSSECTASMRSQPSNFTTISEHTTYVSTCQLYAMLPRETGDLAPLHPHDPLDPSLYIQYCILCITQFDWSWTFTWTKKQLYVQCYITIFMHHSLQKVTLQSSMFYHMKHAHTSRNSFSLDPPWTSLMLRNNHKCSLCKTFTLDTLHHVQKKCATLLLSLTLPNVDQFAKFFHWQISRKLMTKYSILL